MDLDALEPHKSASVAEMEKHKRVLIQIRNEVLSSIAQAEDQRTILFEKRAEKALSAAIRLVEKEIGTLKAIESYVEDQRVKGKH